MNLRIIRYDPSDYQLGKVLSSGAGDIINDIERISSVLALGFKWGSSEKTWISFENPPETKMNCRLFHDEEERKLTQIFIEVEAKSLKTLTRDNCFLKMVLFENCFEFESEIMEQWEEGDKTYIIIEPPREIKSLRARKSFRVEKSQKSVKADWQTEGNTTGLNITSMSLNTIECDSKLELFSEGTLLFQDKALPGECIKTDKGFSYIKINIKSSQHVDALFEILRQFKHPNLVNRKEVPVDNLINLYERSGYFSKFSSSLDCENKIDRIKETWNTIDSAAQNISRDFCLIKEAKLIGASGLGMALNSEKKEQWAFHQLCSDTDLSDLDQTAELYIWRAEYLYMKKENLDSIFWFRSQSRWLERIYVKFLMQNPELGELRNSFTYSYLHKATSSKIEEDQSYDVETVQIGNLQRVFINSEGVEAGAGPEYLHANRNMNIIYSQTGKWKDITSIADRICSHFSLAEFYFRIESEVEIDTSEINDIELQKGSDRFARIHKDGMLDFITCINHSIAVTKHKKGLA